MSKGIERGGRYTRHYMTPAAHPPRPSLMDTLRSIVHKTFWPEEPEGRRRVIPGQPFDNHAAGWSEPTMPPERERE